VPPLPPPSPPPGAAAATVPTGVSDSAGTAPVEGAALPRAP